MKALHPDDEFLGTLSVNHSFGDLCFGHNMGDDGKDATNPAQVPPTLRRRHQPYPDFDKVRFETGLRRL